MENIEKFGSELLQSSRGEQLRRLADSAEGRSLSEKLEPGQVVQLLNRYFTPMTACVKQREGTLDKFVGDALMAFWNAPVDVKDHARKAVEAACAMQRELENTLFLAYAGRVFTRYKQEKNAKKERFSQRKDYVFFKCPSCGTMIRVPRGKGKIHITCRCGYQLYRKT